MIDVRRADDRRGHRGRRRRRRSRPTAAVPRRRKPLPDIRPTPATAIRIDAEHRRARRAARHDRPPREHRARRSRSAFGGLTVATAEFATRDPNLPITFAAREGERVVLAGRRRAVRAVIRSALKHRTTSPRSASSSSPRSLPASSRPTSSTPYAPPATTCPSSASSRPTDDAIVGHVDAQHGARRASDPVLGLGPIAVDPARQQRRHRQRADARGDRSARATEYPLIAPARPSRATTRASASSRPRRPSASRSSTTPARGLDGARAARVRAAHPRPLPLRRSLRLTRAVAARLGAVAAHAHRAPRARVVAREVVERPAAVVGGADLQPLPRPVGRRAGDDREQPRPTAPGGTAASRGVAVRREARPRRAASRASASSAATAPRSTGSAVVREQQRAQRLAEARTTGAERRPSGRTPAQAVLDEPRAVQRVGALLEVERVDQRAGRASSSPGAGRSVSCSLLITS